ncbi:ArsR/SmtB family transcription factor [Actinacidiphila acididurans]|uniref:Helix-turn-helix transcriptional regulator n=1 Tax=Actinacidiphila acididurans TaxID=2784346 RepID=A0ABS2U0D7_9ACTN|nr:metalloregulator ArsR/SmtB family transcription factor [Actinacidiphila acididurans]MBM9509054.1 helix-turn-helix transcriptional regulator [Actinacidiphila acididurans]
MTRPAGQLGDPSPDVLQGAAAAFGLLASTMRLHIVWILSQGDCDVTGLAERVGATLPAVSQHLAKLKLAGLVHSRREGRRQVYLVDDPALVTVVRVMVDQHGGPYEQRQVRPPDGRSGQVGRVVPAGGVREFGA